MFSNLLIKSPTTTNTPAVDAPAADAPAADAPAADAPPDEQGTPNQTPNPKKKKLRVEFDYPSDDEISLTSTAGPSHKEDEEFHVVGVLAEEIDNKGKLWYLIEWVGYDQFKESTWEPHENLGEDLLATWEERKAKEKAGELVPFDIDKYNDIQHELKCEKEERHFRRNARRRRLGLSETSPFERIYTEAPDRLVTPLPQVDGSDSSGGDETGDEFELSSGESSTSEAVEDPTVVSEHDDVAARSPSKRGPNQTGLPKAKPTPLAIPQSDITRGTRKKTGKQLSDTDRIARWTGSINREPASKPTSEGANRTAKPPPIPKKKPSLKLETTGYKGTARKLSGDSTEVAAKSKGKDSNPPSASATASAAATVAVAAKPIADPPQPTWHTFTAKKTIHKTGNIFTGGKMRKTRSNLGSVMSDPTKPAKFFGMHRFRRKAELLSRDKEDLAPDASKMNLFPVTLGPAAARRFSRDSNKSPTTPATVPETPQDAVDTVAPASPQPKTTSVTAAVVPDASKPLSPMKKRKKSVRFIVDDDDDDDDTNGLFVEEPEPMQIDSPVIADAEPRPLLRGGNLNTTALQGPVVFHEAVRPATVSAPKSNDAQNTAIAQGSMTSLKKLVLGQSPAIEMTFHGLPESTSSVHQPNSAWLADFLAAETLSFQYTSIAPAAEKRFSAMISRPLGCGDLVSDTESRTLGAVAKYLRSSMLGLLCIRSKFNVLIYPTKCEGWNSVPLAPQELTGVAGPEIELRHYIFESNQPLDTLIPLPDHAARSPLPVRDTIGESTTLEVLMKRLFNMDYAQLLPTAKPLTSHNFFLAIPSAKRHVGLAIKRWLRECHSTSQIYTSDDAGGWDAFRSKLSSDSMPGVVIVHEALAWSLMRFPNLSQYLINDSDAYWCLTEPTSSTPIYPSLPFLERPVRPGDMRLTRLFPHGSAILLTPSFLVSEPQRAFDIIEWFLTYHAKGISYRLVTAWDIHEYLAELAEEKERARNQLYRDTHVTETTTSVTIAANLRGLEKGNCELRHLTATKAFELYDLRRKRVPPYGDDEESCSLVFADKSIDPNDEQSLVNWFGWWSILRADQFRTFHVVGSGQQIKTPQCGRGEREIRIPKYSKITVNDPDAVLQAVHQHQKGQEQLQKTASVGVEPQEPAEPRPEARPEVRPGVQRQNSLLFKSSLLLSEHHQCFTDQLDNMKHSSREQGRLPWILYKYPVSWLDFEMADYFEDFHLGFKKFNDWFSFAWPFNPHRGFSTYMGFFYSIAEDWDPANKPRSRKPNRHPWLAIYRPSNVHKLPWVRTELIIWDPAVRDKFGTEDSLLVDESKLTDMQRRLIEYVRVEGGKKNKGTYLETVWIGGFRWPAECEPDSYHIDVLLTFLKNVTEDLALFKNTIPAPFAVMAKHSSGYRMVGSEESAAQHQQKVTEPARSSRTDGQDDGGCEMSLDSSDELLEDENTRIIFHPPRGIGRPIAHPPSRSRCHNRLYEEARIARNKFPKSRFMPYKFRPTLDWYSEQQIEGRGYSHLNVDSWENIFPKLKIAKSASSADAQGGRMTTD
ncbi:chromo domain-containing protein 1 [Podospora australis]|uniref:Chromo domain-containing protein 1 n=1 Tax=Podospora australis TaxID=1536484 RepID=A0AAN6WP56_9PEZI|nr:chromo domain-containing protein 1 [Podospora australis]